jgi:hypothetical protein
MKYNRYCPSTLEKLPYLKNIKRCWQTEDGIYDILYEVIDYNEIKYKHLLIQRIDNEPIRNYIDLQEIKNDLLGEDVEAVEVFPKKCDLLNGANVYHLWTWDGIVLPNLKYIKDRLKNS